MMVGVLSAGVMASGRGSRLVAEGVTVPKPLVHVAGRPVISYFLDEAARVDIEHIVVTVRNDDFILPQTLSQDERFSWEFISTEGAGTLESVALLTERLQDVDHLISTCDVILPIGTLERLLKACAAPSTGDAFMLLLGTDIVHDVSPIWLHVDPQRPGVVTDIGKDIRSSDTVFGNIRWVRRGLWSKIKLLDLEGVTRDTQFMSQLVGQNWGGVHVYIEPGVVDVDDLSDIAFAEQLISRGSANSRYVADI